MAEGPRVQVSPFPGQFPTQDYSAAGTLGQPLPSAPTALGNPNKAKLKGSISSSRSKQSPAEVKTQLMLTECSARAQHGTWAPSAEHFILTSLCCHYHTQHATKDRRSRAVQAVRQGQTFTRRLTHSRAPTALLHCLPGTSEFPARTGFLADALT